MIAYETVSCFKSHFSKNGGGFFGFRLFIKNTNVRPHFAVLYGYERKIRNPTQLFNSGISNYQIRNSVYPLNTEESDDSEESEYSSEYNDDYMIYVPDNPHPSAPNLGYAMPSAPPMPDNGN